MSSLIVIVRKIEDVYKHPNAEKLELLQVGGWQVVSGAGNWKVGDLCVYVPPDSIIPLTLSDRLEVTKYTTEGRVKVTKLRGENSFGLVFPPELGMVEGQDVADFYGITKYIPPVKFSQGDAEPESIVFFKYTNIENARNFKRVLISGEEVIITEKIHGTSSRIGTTQEDGIESWVAGSSKLQRRQDPNSLYWFPFYSIPQVKALMADLRQIHKGAKSVIFYGEIYGKGVQNFDYGLKDKAWALFDIAVDGKYLDFDLVVDLAKLYKVPLVPVLFKGEYSYEQMVFLSKGKPSIGGNHVREGVVVKPSKERSDSKMGRVILKYVSDDYLNKQTEDFVDQ